MPAVLLSNRWIRTGSGPGRLTGAAGIAATCVLGALVLLWGLRTGASRSLVLLIPMVPAALVGSVVIAARPRDPVGWSLLVSGGLFLIGLAGEQWVLMELPGAPVAVWLQTWTYQIALIPLFVLVPLHFPDGRLPSRRWRPVLRAALLVLPLLGVTGAFRPGAVPVGDRRVPNPYAADFLTRAGWLDPALGLATVTLVLLAASSLVVRFRTAPPGSRARIALLMATFAVAALAFVLDAVVALGSPDSYEGVFVFVQIALAAVVVAVAIGVVHHRLLDEVQLVDRTLLYVLLTGCVLLLCTAVVAALGMLSFDSQAATLVAVLVVAVVVPALRGWLQRGVDRLVYGDRADPYRALSVLGRRSGRRPPRPLRGGRVGDEHGLRDGGRARTTAVQLSRAHLRTARARRGDGRPAGAGRPIRAAGVRTRRSPGAAGPGTAGRHRAARRPGRRTGPPAVRGPATVPGTAGHDP